MKIEDFEASIYTYSRHGRAIKLEEFRTSSNDAGHEASSFICSSDNAHFFIAVERLPFWPPRDVCIEVSFDGVDSPSIKTYPVMHLDKAYIRRLRVGPTEKAPLMFTKLDLQPVSDFYPSFPEELGTIEIRLYAVELTDETRETDSSQLHCGFDMFDETALIERESTNPIPLSHKVGLGECEQAAPRRGWCRTKFYTCEDPIATFKFSYASRQVLEASGIVPPRSDERKWPAVALASSFRAWQIERNNDALKRRVARLERRVAKLKRRRPEQDEMTKDSLDRTSPVRTPTRKRVAVSDWSTQTTLCGRDDEGGDADDEITLHSEDDDGETRAVVKRVKLYHS